MTRAQSPTSIHHEHGAAMPQSLSRILVHLIFSTKNRSPFLLKPIRPELHKYMAGILDEWDSPGIIIGSVADHAHLLFCLSKNHALSKVVEQVKKGSSKWIKNQGLRYANFHWQAGYGAFSVSQSNVPRVKSYIAGQEEHHRTRNFQDELRAFLRRHQIAFDERYVWN
jgi:REP element-mobilizing transposase RayT